MVMMVKSAWATRRSSRDQTVTERLIGILPEALSSRIIRGYSELLNDDIVVRVEFVNHNYITAHRVTLSLDEWDNEDVTVARICLEVP
jgi:hypothetical protein